jgi:hypothetical protein
MEEQLTDEMINKICMFLRIIDLFNNNREKMEEIPEIKKEYERLSTTVNEIMNNLTEEQRDKVLEIHKIQTEEIRSQH